jgi:membrane-associated protein
MAPMESVLELLRGLHSSDGLRQLVQVGGLTALIAIIFAETGLLAGFFLPGDSLLVTAGIFAASDGKGGPPLFGLSLLLISLSLAAVIGDQVGYLLGKKTGGFAFRKEDSLFFKKKHLVAAQGFYDKHGAKALVIARFMPIFRTFVPFVAGMANMDYARFVKSNVIGGVLWVNSMLLLGYFLGLTPLAQELHKIIIVVVVISILPIIVSGVRGWMLRRQTAVGQSD